MAEISIIALATILIVPCFVYAYIEENVKKKKTREKVYWEYMKKYKYGVDKFK